MAQSDTMASRTNSTPHVNRDPPRLALTHPSSFQTPVWAKDDSSLSSLSHPSSSTPGTRVVGQQTLTRQQQNTRRPLVLHTPPPLPLPKGERPKLRKRSSSLPLLNTISTTSKDTQAEPSGAGSTLTSASTLGLSPTPPTKDDSIAGNPSCSSIIATPMGLGQSKQLPPTPTLTPSQLENGGHAHDAHSKEGGRREGNKLRRAFAARRRENIRGWKSEDVFEVLSSGTGQTYAGSPPSSHTSATAVATTTTAMNVRGRPLEAASSSQVSPKPKATRSLPNPAIELVVVDSNGAETGSSAPHEIHTASPPNSRIHASSHQRKDLPIAPVAGYGHSTPSHRVLGLGLHTTSIPTQATAPKPKKSYLVPPHLSISTSQSAPGAPSAALSLLSSAAIPQTARSTASTKTNRTSVIPLSPGISSAVNYMMMQTPSPIASPIDGDKGTGEIVKGKREEPLQGGTTTTTMGSLPSKTTSGQGGDEDERSSSAHVAGQAHERQPMAATSTAVPIVSTDTTPVASFGSKSSAEVPSTSASPSAPESASPGIKEATTVPTTVSALALNPQSRNQMALNLNGADSSGAKDSTLNHESTEVVATMPTTTTVAAGTSSSMLAPSIQSVAPALSSAALPSTMSVPTSQPAQLTSIPPSSPPQPTAAVPFTSSAYAPSSPPQPQLYSINSNRFSLTNRPRPLSTGTTSTARAGGSGPGSAGASRPVSWAESFQSACTVVPGEEGRRRLSALALTGEKWKEEDEYLDAAEQEEDEEEFFSAPSTAAIGSPPPLGMVVSTATVSQKAKEDMSNQGRGRETQPMKPEDKTQSKLRNRRSMSLDSTGVLKEPLVGLASKRSKELLSSSAIGDANPLPSSTLPPTREDTAKTGNATGKEDKPEVPPKPKRYEPTQQKSKHIRAPSIGSSISQPAGSVSSHSESVSGPSGPSNLALSTKGNITLGSGVYAHAHGKSSSHSNLLGLSSYEREKQEKNGHSHPPSTMHNAGLRSRFVAWTGMGSSSSTDGERRKETSSASSISMSMASGTGSVTSFSSNSNAVGQASLSSSWSSFSGVSALSGVPQAPHSHLGHGQSGHAQTSHTHGQHLAQNQGTPTHPHSHSHRATTLSVSGLGPAAAGLAKRAVEKMGRKWGAKIGFGGLSGGTSLGVDKGGDDGNGSMGSGVSRVVQDTLLRFVKSLIRAQIGI
ncbi:hypothetical protein CPB83DRAFT_456968 [Crepidotus variabilis]|uniref:Uncharacterized protein n=1 Tax=Crepidotus variabilis TaxID=179855 RepID=A0A9P6EBR3_9AGAR|nr:hypothetical protein CPB83DRAFT_456968 [Crepidotus variabilis]